LGYPTQGAQLGHDAIDLARRLQHAPSLAHALWFVCQGQVVRNDPAAAINTATELLTLSEEHGLSQQRAFALVYLGWAISQTKDVAGGVKCLEEAFAVFKGLGLGSNLFLAIFLFAETYSTGGRYESAMDQLNQAITTS